MIVPVPGGFVVLTEAYRRFLAANDPDGCLRGRLDRAAMDGTDGVLSSEARDLFLSGVMPPELEDEILGAYERLGRPVTVVRSSANADWRQYRHSDRVDTEMPPGYPGNWLFLRASSAGGATYRAMSTYGTRMNEVKGNRDDCS